LDIERQFYFFDYTKSHFVNNLLEKYLIAFEYKKNMFIYKEVEYYLSNQFSLVFIRCIWYNLSLIEVKQAYKIQIDITAVHRLSYVLSITHFHVNDLSLNNDCSFFLIRCQHLLFINACHWSFIFFLLNWISRIYICILI
jgi:hypothetical protein